MGVAVTLCSVTDVKALGWDWDCDGEEEGLGVVVCDSSVVLEARQMPGRTKAKVEAKTDLRKPRSV